MDTLNEDEPVLPSITTFASSVDADGAYMMLYINVYRMCWIVLLRELAGINMILECRQIFDRKTTQCRQDASQPPITASKKSNSLLWTEMHYDTGQGNPPMYRL